MLPETNQCIGNNSVELLRVQYLVCHLPYEKRAMRVSYTYRAHA